MKNIRSVSQNIQTIDSRIRVVKTSLQQLQQDVASEADIRNEADIKIKVKIGAVQVDFANSKHHNF